MAKPAKNLVIELAVLLTQRMELRDAFRDALKKLGVTDVKIVSDADSCLSAVSNKIKALIVLDWDITTERHIRKILDQFKQNHKLDARPIFFMAKQATDHLLGMLKEYGISKFYSGELSPKKLQELIQQLYKDEENYAPLRTVLTKVSQKRDGGDWQGAEQLLVELSAKIPQNHRVTVELAQNKIVQEKWEEALLILEPLQDLNPPYLRALHLLAKCKLKLGKKREAAEVMKMAKIINPFNADRLVMLGNVLLSLDQVQEARLNFEEASEIDPEKKEAVEGVGKCMLLDGEINDAIDLLKEVSSPRELASVFNTTAILSMRHGRFKEGMSLYLSAEKSVPADDYTLARLAYNRGVGYIRWHKESEALSSFEQALRFDGQFEKAKISLANLSARLGKEVPQNFMPRGSAPMSSTQVIIKPEETKEDYLGLQSDDDDLDDELVARF